MYQGDNIVENISGKMILITSEERKKVAQRNFAFETFIFSLLDSLYRPSIIFNILYILINSKSKFFKNKGGKIKGTLENGDFEIEMRHSGLCRTICGLLRIIKQK